MSGISANGFAHRIFVQELSLSYKVPDIVCKNYACDGVHCHCYDRTMLCFNHRLVMLSEGICMSVPVQVLAWDHPLQGCSNQCRFCGQKAQCIHNRSERMHSVWFGYSPYSIRSASYYLRHTRTFNKQVVSNTKDIAETKARLDTADTKRELGT